MKHIKKIVLASLLLFTAQETFSGPCRCSHEMIKVSGAMILTSGVGIAAYTLYHLPSAIKTLSRELYQEVTCLADSTCHRPEGYLITKLIGTAGIVFMIELVSRMDHDTIQRILDSDIRTF